MLNFSMPPTTEKLKSHRSLGTKQSGLSLIELMVALAISSLLMLGVSSLYLNSRQTDQFSYELGRMQEVGRMATNFLAKDIRMAGYQGCLDPASTPMTVIAKNPPTTTNTFFDTALRGFETATAGWAAADAELSGTDIENLNISGSDVLAIQGAAVSDMQLTGNMLPNNANIQINNNSLGLQADDLVLIADCQTADMFRVNSVSQGGGMITVSHANSTNTANKLSQPYQANAQILSFQSFAYFVGDTGRVNKQGFAINALYRYRNTLDINNASAFVAEELVPGIDSMQLQYGERLATGNLKYVTADNVTNWQMVESIQLGILVSGDNESAPKDDDQDYALPGAIIQPTGASGAVVTHEADRRLRRPFTVTVNLHNRRTQS